MPRHRRRSATATHPTPTPSDGVAQRGKPEQQVAETPVLPGPPDDRLDGAPSERSNAPFLVMQRQRLWVTLQNGSFAPSDRGIHRGSLPTKLAARALNAGSGAVA